MKTKVMQVTPDQARAWLARNHESNRKIEQDRVDSYADDMRQGRWTLTHQGIAFDKRERLIDGQHRLAAVVAFGKSVPMLVCWNDEATLDDPIDRARPRSLAFLVGVTTRRVGAITCCGSLELGYRVKIPSVGFIQEVAERNADAFRTFDEKIEKFERLASAGLAGALAWTFPVAKMKTVHFAEQVIFGEMIQRGDPAFALRNWLQRNKGHGLKPWDAAMATLKCFTSFLADEKVKNVYSDSIEGYGMMAALRRKREIPYTPSSADIAARYPKGGMSAFKLVEPEAAE